MFSAENIKYCHTHDAQVHNAANLLFSYMDFLQLQFYNLDTTCLFSSDAECQMFILWVKEKTRLALKYFCLLSYWMFGLVYLQK